MGQFGRVFRKKKPHRSHIGNRRMMTRGSHRPLDRDLRPLLTIYPASNTEGKAGCVGDEPEQELSLRRTNNVVGFVDDF